MLHILLLILKIIGIILLAILGILILLLLIVLFVPLRYQLSLDSKGDIKTTTAKAKFLWLLHFISGQAIYENEEFDWKVRIAWKTIKEEKETEPAAEAVEKSVEETDSITEIKSEKKKEKVEKQEKQLEKEEKEVEEEGNVSEAAEEKTSKIEKIKCTIKSIYDKIKLVIDFIRAEAHILALARLKKELIRLLKFLKPKKIQGKLRFGMEDPYHTGQILAGLSVLYPFYGENLEIYPDFEEKILEGDLFVKGHVRGVYALIVVWNVILDKHVRATFKDIKSLL